MIKRHPRRFLLFTLFLMLLLPFAGGWLKWRDTEWNGLPPGFGIFPERHSLVEEPDFSPVYFAIVAIIALITIAFLVFPRWFGFKPKPSVEETEKHSKAAFPWWFWVGLVVNLTAWAIMWARFDWLGPLVHFTFVPLWWGFILVLDGIVYRRSGGKSILATDLRWMAGLVITSVLFWFLFEFYDYFVLENWYYPNHEIFSPLGYRIWFSLCYTTVWPAIFEFYFLLRTFKTMNTRWTGGRGITLSPTVAALILISGLLVTFGVGALPHVLFFGVWVGPLILTTGALSLAGYWTPFHPVEKGDWTMIALFGISGFLNGIFWETWNGISHSTVNPVNPSFWRYEVPFIDVAKIFEMPVLGFVGYVPFGVMAVVAWVFLARLLNWNPRLGPSEATE